MRTAILVLVFFCIGLGNHAGAGVHNPLEPPLKPDPDLLRFLEQLRVLRGHAPRDAITNAAETAQRLDYLAKIKALQEQQRTGPLAPDAAAGLGAYLLRVRKTDASLPDFEEAVAVLHAAQRQHPRHFALAANLGTAYQLSGRLDAAERYLDQAVALAPDEWLATERVHLTLVQRRLREPPRQSEIQLDPLFGPLRQPLQFVGPSGQWEPGRLAEAERAKLPGGSLEIATLQVQQLLLWLPEDGRLVWLLGELANAQGNLRAARQALDAAVDNFRISTRELRLHRRGVQEALAWREVMERVGDPPHQVAWLARSLASKVRWGLADPPGLYLAEIIPPPPDPAVGLLDFADGPPGAKSVGPVASTFVLEPRHWVMIAGGAAVILLLLVLQVRQFFRPRARPKPN